MQPILKFLALTFTSLIVACSGEQTVPHQSKDSIFMSKDLIILAAPPDRDTYYTDVREEIFDFHVAYGKEIRKHDDVIILTGKRSYEKYAEALGADHVAPAEMLDIWMRDFGSLNTAAPIFMRYSAEGQGGGRKGQSEADAVQDKLARITEAASLGLPESGFINDGGNYVDDYLGNVVISRKFLRDNHLTEPEGRAAIRDLTGARHVAFIEADEQGGLEHADGVAAFISENTLVINSYPNDPDYAADLKADLKRGLPGVILHEIVTPYDGSVIYDERFGSACGLYTNMLVTPNRIYLPQFGIPQDAQALADIQRWSDKEIIPVMSQGVCKMGGGVRCMSWQLRGEPAHKLAAYLRSL